MAKQQSRVQTRETSSWTVTRSEIVKFSYKWVIENFTFYPGDSVIVSPPFSANNNDETQWSLKVFPNGDDEESKDWISVFLHLHACKSDYVPAKYKISILNVKQEPIQTTQVNAAVKFEKGRGCGSKRFIRRESILNDIQNCLPCDRLTVLCEMSVLGGTSHISGLNCPVPSESPGSAEPGEPWITRGGGVVPRAIGTVSAPQDDGKQETLERKASDRDDDSREPGDWIKIVRKYTNLAAEGKALAAAITMDLNPRKDPPKSVKGRRSSGSTSVERKDLPGADCIGICERRLYEQTEVLGALVKDARIAAAEAKKQRCRGTTRSSGAGSSKSARAYEPLRNLETDPDRPHSVDEIKVKISNPDLARSLSENLEKTHISSLASSGPTDEAPAGNAMEAQNSTHPAEPRGKCPVQRREAQRLLVHDHHPFDHLSPSVAEHELHLHDSEQLGVEVFTGVTTDFYAWWADFEEKVHNRSDLSTHQKFAYLKSLLDGDVASAVEITGTEEANFYGTLLNLFHRYSDYDRLDRSARSVSLATAAGAAGEAGSNVDSQAETSRRLSAAREEKNKGSRAGAAESASENQPPDTESPCPPHRVLPRRRSRK